MVKILLLCALLVIASCGLSEPSSMIIESPLEQASVEQPKNVELSKFCGDGVCTDWENKCTCPKDCGVCEELSNATVQFTCRGDQCMNIDSYCGDKICDDSERGSCVLDCPTCDDNNACTRDRFELSQQRCLHETITPCCGNGQCEVGEPTVCQNDCYFEYTLADYPQPFVIEEQMNSLIVVGSESGAKGVIAAINVIRGLQFSGAKQGYTTESVLDTDIDSITNKNVILIGNPCHNRFVAELYKKKKENCGEGLAAGQKIIKLFKTGTATYALVISGYSEDEVREASTIVEKWQELHLSGMEWRP